MRKIFICTLTIVLVTIANTLSSANPVKGKKYRSHPAVNSSKDNLSRKSNFPPKEELPSKKIKWVEDEGGVDCISYMLVSDKVKYKTGEVVNLKIRLDYNVQLPVIWRQKNCTNLSIKLVFPENFIQTGGSYYDFIPLIFSDKEKFKELTIEGKFISANTNTPCLLLLKGPEFSNVETIFIKKLTKCLEVENDPSSFTTVEKRKIIGLETKYTNFGSLSTKQKNEAIKQQFTIANTNSPIRLYTINPDLCPINESCDSTNLCAGEKTVLHATGCENGIIQWSTGEQSDKIQVSPLLNTTYFADCIVNQSLESTDSAKITVSAETAINYNLTITGPDSICAGQSLELIANGCPATATYLFTLQNDAGLIQSEGDVFIQTTEVYFEGNYKASFKCVENGICGSTESPLKTIKIIQPGIIDSVFVPSLGTKYSASNLTSALNNIFCVGEQVQFSVDGCNGQIKWPDNSLGNNYSIIIQSSSQSISYTCEYNGCERTGNLTFPAGVLKLNTPTLVFDYDTQVDVKATQKTNANTLTLKAGQCDREYKWWDGLQTQSSQRTIDVSSNLETNIYSVKCADPNGECISDSASVGLYIISISATKDSLCFGESAELIMTGCTNGIVRWYKENETSYFAGGSPIEFTNESNNQVNFKFYGKCITNYFNSSTNFSLNSNSDSIVLFNLINPPIIVANKTVLTTGELSTLNASNCDGTILWSNGQIGNSINIPITINYEINATCGKNGCQSLPSNTIKLYPCGEYKPTFEVKSISNIPNGGKYVTFKFTNPPISGVGIRLEGVSDSSRVILNQQLPLLLNYEKGYSVFENTTFTLKPYGTSCLIQSSESIKILASGNSTPKISSSILLDNVNIAVVNSNIITNTLEFCTGQISTIYASGCSPNQYNWWIMGLGTQSNHSNTLEINSTIASYAYGYVTCSNSGFESFPNWFALSRIVRPLPVTLTTTTPNICNGQFARIDKTLPTNDTEWYNGNNQLISNTLISTTSSLQKSRLFVNPASTESYYALNVFRPNYKYEAHLCKSLPSNVVVVNVSEIIPSKQIINSSSNQFCGSEEITIKSSNCDGTLNWQWSNTNGQSGTLTADSIKTTLAATTTYSAKCTNTCGTSAQWSEPLTITSITVPPPVLSTNLTVPITNTPITITASNCSGQILWSTGEIGTTITKTFVEPTSIYATCQYQNCESSFSNQIQIQSCNLLKPQIISITKSNATTCNFTISHSGCPTNATLEFSIKYPGSTTTVTNTYYYNVSNPIISLSGSNAKVVLNCNLSGCKSLTSDTTVVVYDAPEVPVISGNDFQACVGDTLRFYASGCSGQISYSPGVHTDNYSIRNDSLLIFGLNPDPTREIYGYTLSASCKKNGCIANSATKTFAFYKRPTQKPLYAPINYTPSLQQIPGDTLLECEGRTVQMGAYCQRGTALWLNGNLDQFNRLIHTSNSQETYYTLCYNRIKSCTSSDTSHITIIRYPNTPSTPLITSDKTLICSGDSINFTFANFDGIITARAVENQFNWAYDGFKNNVKVETKLFGSTYNALTTNYDVNQFTNFKIPFSLDKFDSVVVSGYRSYCGIRNYQSNKISILLRNPTPPAITVSNQIVCNSATGRVPITFTASGCTGGVITWSDGSIGQTFQKLINESIIYSATCTIGSCVSEPSNLIQITVLDPPLPPVLSATNLIKCSDDTAPITITAEACNGTLTWAGLSSNSETIQVTPSITTTYTATCTNPCGSTSESITITVEQKPAIPTIGASNLTICKNEQVTLTVNNCDGLVFWPLGWEEGDTLQYSLEETTVFKAICFTNSGTCSSDTASITVNVIDAVAPTIDLLNSIICEGEVINLTQTACERNITWHNITAMPAELLGTSTSLALTISDTTQVVLSCNTNDCLTRTSDTITLAPQPKLAPLSILASKDSLCAGESVVLEANTCLGTLLWSTGSNANTITVTPTNNTTYSVQCIATCDTTSANFTIVINQPGTEPNIAAFPSSICAGETARLTVSNCLGSLVWVNGSVSSDNVGLFVSPTITTTYSAICNTNGCLSDTNSIEITVNSPTVPLLTTTTATSVCANSNITLKVENCVGTVLWNDGSTSVADLSGVSTKSFNINTQTSYFASCETLGCGIVDSSNTITVDVLPLPTIPTVSYSKNSVCLGDSFTATATNCTGTITWSTGETASSITITPTLTSTYFANCTTTCGTSPNSESTTIQVFTPSTPSIAVSDSIICAGQPSTITARACAGTIEWTGANFTITSDSSILVSPTANATYSAVCKNGSCQSLPVSTQITVRPTQTKPVLSTTNNQTTFCTDNSFTITATGCETGSLTWSNGTINTNSITITPANRGVGVTFNYSVTCSDICGNVISDPLTITIVKPIKPQILPATLEVCLGKPFNLNVSTSCPNGFLQWKNNAFKDSTTNAIGQANEIGQYYYSVRCVIANCTSEYSDSVLVRVNPIPDAAITTNSIVYVGDAINFTSTFRASSYQWTGPNGFSSTKRSDKINKANSVNGGVYTLTVSGTGVCSATASVNITVLPATTFAVRSNSPICESQTLTLSAEGGKNYAWSGPNGFTSNAASISLANASVNASGTYTVTVTTKKNTTTTASIAITINPKPKGFMANQSACSGNKISLNAPLGSSYKWTGPNNFISARQNPELTNLGTPQQGAYKVVVNTLAGCSDSSSFNLVVNPSPTFTLTSNSPLDPGQELNVSSTATGALQWSGPQGFGATTQNIQIQNITPEQAGYYKLKVTNAFNCTKSDSVNILVTGGAFECNTMFLSLHNDDEKQILQLERNSVTGENKSAILKLSGLEIPAGLNYQWKYKDQIIGITNQLNVSNIGEYSLNVSNASKTCIYNFNISGEPCFVPNATEQLQCTASFDMPSQVTNGVEFLKPGDKFLAADYTFQVTEVSGSLNTGFTGKAIGTLRVINGVEIKILPIEFKNIALNTCYQFIGTTVNPVNSTEFVGIRTEYDPTWKNIIDLNVVAKKVKELFSTQKDVYTQIFDELEDLDCSNKDKITELLIQAEALKGNIQNTFELAPEQKTTFISTLTEINQSISCFVQMKCPSANGRMAQSISEDPCNLDLAKSNYKKYLEDFEKIKAKKEIEKELTQKIIARLKNSDRVSEIDVSDLVLEAINNGVEVLVDNDLLFRYLEIEINGIPYKIKSFSLASPYVIKPPLEYINDGNEQSSIYAKIQYVQNGVIKYKENGFSISGSTGDMLSLFDYINYKEINVMLFVNGYLGPLNEFTDTRNEIWQSDKNEYWNGDIEKLNNEFDRAFVQKRKASQVYYTSGHMSIVTSNHNPNELILPYSLSEVQTFPSILNFAESMVSSLLQRVSESGAKAILEAYGFSPDIIEQAIEIYRQRCLINNCFVELNTNTNYKGYNVRYEWGRIAGRNLVSELRQLTLNTKAKINLDIVAHSMGYAYAQGVISSIKENSVGYMPQDPTGVTKPLDISWDGYYIFAPENGNGGSIDPIWSKSSQVFQYGSNLGETNQDVIYLQDGVAPQSKVRGLRDNQRVFIPDNSNGIPVPKNFLDSHSIKNYWWVFNLKKENNENGVIKEK